MRDVVHPTPVALLPLFPHHPQRTPSETIKALAPAVVLLAACARRIPFVVLDRPNPIGGEIVDGALLDPRFKTFVGMYPIPARAVFRRDGAALGEPVTQPAVAGRVDELSRIGLLRRYDAHRRAGDGEHARKTIPAIRFAITDRQAYRPVRTSLVLIDAIRRHHPRDFAWTGTIDRLTGSDKVRRAIEGGRLEPLLAAWDRGAAGFRESRRPFLLY